MDVKEGIWKLFHVLCQYTWQYPSQQSKHKPFYGKRWGIKFRIALEYNLVCTHRLLKRVVQEPIKTSQGPLSAWRNTKLDSAYQEPREPPVSIADCANINTKFRKNAKTTPYISKLVVWSNYRKPKVSHVLPSENYSTYALTMAPTTACVRNDASIR